MTMNSVSIVNYLTDMVGDGKQIEDVPKQIRVGACNYAFVRGDVGLELWVWAEDQWCQVSDLTCMRVWQYQEIKSYAVAVGMVEEDEDLFI